MHAAGIAPEALAELIPEHRRFLRRIPPAMRPTGAVWRLGVLLLVSPEDHVSPAQKTRRRQDPAPSLPLWLVAGPSTRSAERGRPNFQSESREQRREIAAAALRGGYPVGTIVHFDAEALPSDDAGLAVLGDDSPVGLHDGVPRVRWRAGMPLASSGEFERYVSERVGLLVEPPLGAS
nr:hypothetical protein [Leucobacter sp. cx-169]